MSSVDGARSLQAASDETFTNVCGPCNYSGNQNEATNFCDDCRELLCRSCTASHKGQKISRNHKILPVTDLSRRAVTKQAVSCSVICECSQNLEVAIYCEKHDDVMCQTCETIKHRQCKTVSLSKISGSYNKTKLDSVFRSVNKIKAASDKFLNERNVDLQKLDSMKENCKKDIKAFRNELNKILDVLEENILKELEQWESQERQGIERHISSCSTTQHMIVKDLKLLDDVKKISKKTDMFAADVNISNRLKEYERLLQDCIGESNLLSSTFKRNEHLSNVLTEAKSFGTLNVDYSQSHTSKRKVFPDMRVESSSQVEIKFPDDKTCPSIKGCAFMPDGQVMLCDSSNNRVKLLSSSLTIKEKLDLETSPHDVSVINSSSAIITLPDSQQLQYIEVAPTLKTGRVIQLCKTCWGVEVAGEEIYVACTNNYTPDGEVRCLDMNGNLKRRLGVNMFTVSFYLTVSTSSGKIFVCDYYTNRVTCLMSDGSVVYKYDDPDLVYAEGVCVDDEDNIIVCGGVSNNVHTVTADGKKQSIMLTNNDGLKKPWSIAYRHTDNTLIVGCEDHSKLFIFKFA